MLTFYISKIREHIVSFPDSTPISFSLHLSLAIVLVGGVIDRSSQPSWCKYRLTEHRRTANVGGTYTPDTHPLTICYNLLSLLISISYLLTVLVNNVVQCTLESFNLSISKSYQQQFHIDELTFIFVLHSQLNSIWLWFLSSSNLNCMYRSKSKRS